MYFKIYNMVFKICSDADDTSRNLIIGLHLNKLKNKFPELREIWAKNNSGSLRDTFLHITSKSYRLKDKHNIDGDLLDGRTYFYLREYLKDKQDVSLTTTWISSRKESLKKIPYYLMPGNVNNVELCVMSNFMHASTLYIL